MTGEREQETTVAGEHAHEEHFTIRWADLDANGHLRNTVFSELATHTRFRMLEANGFSQAKFHTLRFGPVMFREEVRYRREVRFGQDVTVNVLIDGLAGDGSQWRVRQVVRGPDGKEAAVVTIDGAWIHLDTRRLVLPNAGLLEIMRGLPRTSEFQELRTVMRSGG